MDMSEEMTEDPSPLIDAERLFCLSYHMKGVSNSNYDGRHVHRRLSLIENGILAALKAQICGLAPLSVLEVDITNL